MRSGASSQPPVESATNFCASVSSSGGCSRSGKLSTISSAEIERDFEAYQRCCWIHSGSASMSSSWPRPDAAELLMLRLEREPVEAARRQRQQVCPLADP